MFIDTLSLAAYAGRPIQNNASKASNSLNLGLGLDLDEPNKKEKLFLIYNDVDIVCRVFTLRSTKPFTPRAFPSVLQSPTTYNHEQPL